MPTFSRWRATRCRRDRGGGRQLLPAGKGGVGFTCCEDDDDSADVERRRGETRFEVGPKLIGDAIELCE